MQRRVVGSTCRAEDTATWSEIWRSDGEYTWPLDIFWWCYLINDDFVIHLEAAHIPRIAGILEAVLVALQEELQLEPGQCGHGHLVHSWEEARYILSWTLSGNVFSVWHMRQTHTRTCLPLTNKHSQTHKDIHKCWSVVTDLKKKNVRVPDCLNLGGASLSNFGGGQLKNHPVFTAH